MTWRSINCAFGKLALGLGLDRVVGVMKRMGVKSKLLAVPALATGGNEISPIDMASAFTSITNLGIHHDPYYIDRIEGPDGKVIYEHKDAGVQVLDPNVAAPGRRHPQDPDHAGHRAAGRARRRPAGRRQDRHAGQQHQRLVRRRHAAVHDGRVDGELAEQHRQDDRHPGVPGLPEGPGRHVPGAHLEGVHGRGPRRPPGGGLAEAGASRRARRRACTCPAPSARPASLPDGNADPRRRPDGQAAARSVRRRPWPRCRAARSTTARRSRRCRPAWSSTTAGRAAEADDDDGRASDSTPPEQPSTRRSATATAGPRHRRQEAAGHDQGAADHQEALAACCSGSSGGSLVIAWLVFHDPAIDYRVLLLGAAAARPRRRALRRGPRAALGRRSAWCCSSW